MSFNVFFLSLLSNNPSDDVLNFYIYLHVNYINNILNALHSTPLQYVLLYIIPLWHTHLLYR